MKKASLFFKQIFTKPKEKDIDHSGSDDDLNVITPTHTPSSYDEFLPLLQQPADDTSFGFVLNCGQQFDKYIDFVVVVGFHHSIGAQVEFVYPPLHLDTQEQLNTRFLMDLPGLALPDGSHIAEAGYVYFILRDDRNTFHCVSCFRQIQSDQLINKEESVVRAFVQKAVVVMSKLPLYGEIRSKLQPTTEAYFLQKNFHDQQILNDLYHSANQFNQGAVLDPSQFNAGLNFKKVFDILGGHNVLALVKALLLEKRIVIYSKLASRVSQFLYSIIGLIPGCVYLNQEAPSKPQKYLQQYGFPLQLFANSQLLPMVSVQDIPKIQDNGFLIGTTNQMLLMTKLKADILIDIDKQQFTDNLQSKHTSFEKKMFKYKPQVQAKKQEQIGKLVSGDCEDKQGLISRDDLNEDQLKRVVAEYIQNICEHFAYLKKILVGDEVLQDSGDQTNQIKHSAKQLSKRLLDEGSDSDQEDQEWSKVVSQVNYKQAQKVADSDRFPRQFMLQFAKTIMFRKWVHSHDKQIAMMHPMHEEGAALIHFENGDFYRGTLVQGMKQGFGTYYHCQNEMTYTGEWWADKRHGQGQLTIEIDLYVFEGTWVNDMRDGQGMEVCKKLGKYTGQWEKDKRHGEGVSVNPEGHIYQGSWQHGLKHGKGKLYQMGTETTGEWHKDVLKKVISA